MHKQLWQITKHSKRQLERMKTAKERGKSTLLCTAFLKMPIPCNDNIKGKWLNEKIDEIKDKEEEDFILMSEQSTNLTIQFSN